MLVDNHVKGIFTIITAVCADSWNSIKASYLKSTMRSSKNQNL